MDLKSGYPYWSIKNGLMHSFPSLDDDCESEILIMGGGITSALICRHLMDRGHDVTVVERRDVGFGSSSASTALIQYEIDTHLTELVELYGEARAIASYRACFAAVSGLERIAAEVEDVDFERTRSLYVASRERDVRSLVEEGQLRDRVGLQVLPIGEHELKEDFGIRAPFGILTSVAARMDPFRMALRIFGQASERGANVFARTEVVDLTPLDDTVTATLENGKTITAKHVVIASGYESQHWLRKSVAKNRSSYAFISEPLEPSQLGSLRDTLVWESARPYVYLRTTTDHRVLVGGQDDAIDVPAKRDAQLGSKQEQLLVKMRELMPGLSVRPAFCWAGTFAETEDGLPYFGAHESWGPRVHFAMAYGGNGITYSFIGAHLLAAAIEGQQHELAEFFSFNRDTTRLRGRASPWKRLRRFVTAALPSRLKA